MALFTSRLLALLLLLFIATTTATPLPYSEDEVELMWKRGRSESDILSSLPTRHPNPSALFSTSPTKPTRRSSTSSNSLTNRTSAYVTQYLTTHPQTAYKRRRDTDDAIDFDHALDERSMAAREAKSRGSGSKYGKRESTKARVKEFIGRFLEGKGEGGLGLGLGEGVVGKRGVGAEGEFEEAPVLRPRRGRRWNL
ncbi:hypothetical protein LTR66_002879 [Elasticomyces elasticus]|nr:hypothetical protein LTR50_006705 [Elasticomyces elasticus]KAK4997750.1 hypothetical protein LTR66_002879 [Elasticomyces elasticus]